MKKILVGLAILGVGTVIVLGARKGLQEHAAVAAAPEGERARVEAPAPDTSPPLNAAGTERTDRGPMYPEGEPQRLPAAEGTGEGERSTREPQQGSGSAAESRSVGGGTESDNTTNDASSSTAAAEQDPEVATVLRRTARVYEEVHSLQADFSQRSVNPILRTTVASKGTLYQRSPDRFLMRFSDPAGDLIVSDGSHFWVYYPSVDRKQVLRMPAGQGAGGVDLRAQFLGDPLERFQATYEGRQEVAGRSAYVLLLEPREALGYRTLKVWIDASDYLVRQFEVTEDNGLVRHFELSNLKLNQRLADDLFHFTVPEGAHVVDRG